MSICCSKTVLFKMPNPLLQQGNASQYTFCNEICWPKDALFASNHVLGALFEQIQKIRLSAPIGGIFKREALLTDEERGFLSFNLGFSGSIPLRAQNSKNP